MMNVKKPERNIRVAIVGSRGIPARYGGYETITQDLSIGLGEKGFKVYVACESTGFKRNPYATFKGVNLVYFPIINSIRNLSDVMLYDALSVFWATFNSDIIYMLSYTNFPVLIFPRLFQKTILVNADGLEWKRRKHSKLLRFLLKSFELLSLKIVDCMVVDSQALGVYYKVNYNVDPSYVPYGTNEIAPLDSSNLRKYNVEPKEYYLLIARLEPENNIDLIIDEFKKSTSKKKLVIVAPLKRTSYVKKLLESKSEKVLFIGGIYEPRLQRTLRHNCFAYIHGHEVGGTNPTLVEALSCHNVILALDVPFNKEVAGDSAFYFTKESGNMASKIELLENKTPDQLLEGGKKGYERYVAKYSVAGMVDGTAALFNRVFDHKVKRHPK
jgi:glycosyltransferase involved in cell wall biosynthesis